MMEEEEEKKKKEEETLEGGKGGKKDKRVPWGTEDIDAGEQVALGKP
jgi:hypothetical protein